MYRRILVGALALGLTALATPGSAAGTVTIGGTTRNGDILTVTGTSTFTDQPYVALGTDASGDAPPAMSANGGDVIGASVSTAATGTVRLRWTVAQLTPVINGSPAITFAWTFCTAEESCFELDFGRLAPGGTTPYGVLYRCADPSCDPGGQTSAATGVTGVYDVATNTVTANLPAAAGATAGATMTPVGLDVNGPAYTMLGTASPFTAQYDSGDGVADVTDYIVARKEVSIAVAAPGLDPASVTYGAAVVPAGSGNWSAAASVAGQSGGRAVYARACFGFNNCAYTSSAVTL